MASLTTGADGGLLLICTGTFTVIDRKSGLPSDKVMTSLETVDENGRPVVWVGTYGGGLARVQDGKVTVTDARSGGFDFVVALAETTNDSGKRTLWVGTNGEGLATIENIAAGNILLICRTLTAARTS